MSELTPASVKKLKVAELRSELSNLGLDTKGNKPVLVQRLLEAISGSEGEDGEQNAVDNADDSTVTTEDDSQDENEKPEEVEKPEESEKPAEEAPVEKEVSDEPEPMETTTTETPTTNQPEVEQTSTKQEKVTEESASANDTDKSTEDSEKMEENKESKDEEKPSEETKQDEEQNSEPTNRKRGLLDTPTIPPQPGKVVDLPKDVDFDVTVEFSKVEEEPEAELDDTLVVLDKYTSDLFVKINPEATSCGTMKDECFIFMAGGARSTHGVTSGKVCYEVKVAEVHDVKLPDSEIPKNFVRVGWSVQATNLQLGEDEHSYGYDSTGKKCTNSEFSEFGQTFDKDDVITCYLDLESDVKKISFSKNGEDVGDAFELAEDIQDKAFFPHIYLKNSECEFNFGSKEEAWFAPKEGFSFIQNATTVRSTKGPSDKGECEVLMMIGLPASGKTTWVKKYIAENPDKNYNVLGTSVILDKMKLMGVARKQEYGGFNKHMDKAAKCLHRLFEIAPSKKRNYILDQTNVYMTAQSKKMKSFEGFKRKAIVCIPTQEALKERMEQKKNGGTELPYNAICDMKRNFFLPSVGDLFDEITYVDQDEEQSKAIVAEYAKEVPPQRPRTSSGSYQPDRKRPRYDDRSRHGGYGGGGGGGKWSGGHRDYNRRDDRRSGGFQPYNRRGGYGSPQFGRHGGGRGGFRDNRSGGGRGGYQGGGYHGSGSYNDRNRHGGYGGGNRNYGGGNKGFRGGSNYGNQRQQYNYSNTQQTTSYSPQQPQQQAQQNYNYSQYYQQAYQQAYGQQPQQTTAATPQTQAYQQPQQQQQQQQQYASYYQQGTYPQGYSYGY